MRFPNHGSGVWGASPGIWLPLQPCPVPGNPAQFAELRLRPKRHTFLTRCPSPRPVLHLLATTSTPDCQSPWLLGVQGREGPDPSPGHAREEEREAYSVGGRDGRRVTCIRVCQYSRTHAYAHTGCLCNRRANALAAGGRLLLSPNSSTQSIINTSPKALCRHYRGSTSHSGPHLLSRLQKLGK